MSPRISQVRYCTRCVYPSVAATPLTFDEHGVCSGCRVGEQRKSFMSSCLKGEDAGASDKQKAQQGKMKSCNKDAGDKKLKGDERKKFMSDCLKG